MKARGIFILIPLVVMLFMPLTLHVSDASADEVKYFVSLDVCNGSGFFMPGDDDPSLHEAIGKPVAPGFEGFLERDEPSFDILSVSALIERPPKA